MCRSTVHPWHPSRTRDGDYMLHGGVPHTHPLHVPYKTGGGAGGAGRPPIRTTMTVMSSADRRSRACFPKVAAIDFGSPPARLPASSASSTACCGDITSQRPSLARMTRLSSSSEVKKVGDTLGSARSGTPSPFM